MTKLIINVHYRPTINVFWRFYAEYSYIISLICIYSQNWDTKFSEFGTDRFEKKTIPGGVGLIYPPLTGRGIIWLVGVLIDWSGYYFNYIENVKAWQTFGVLFHLRI